MACDTQHGKVSLMSSLLFSGTTTCTSNGALHAGSDLASAMDGSLSLRYVHVFARHGTRTSVHSVPNVNHPGPCEPAQFSVDDLRAFQLQQVRTSHHAGPVLSTRLLSC